MVTFQNYRPKTMPNLSIKNVPEPMLAQLRARAKQHHRSLQGELLAILEEAVHPENCRWRKYASG